MPRNVPLLCLFVFGALTGACSSDEDRPKGGGIFPSSGGSGGTGGDDASAGSGDSGLGGSGAGLPDGDIPDAATDVTVDTSEAGLTCAKDPAPGPGDGYCVTLDDDGYQCNPITSAPCNVAAGEFCVFDGARFQCVQNDVVYAGACEACGAPAPELCTHGYTCRGLGDRCTRYCCDHFQCAFGEWCVMQPPTTLGICQALDDQALAGFVGAAGPDGGIDGGDPDAALPTLECAPPTAAGDSSCVEITPEEHQCNPITGEGCAASGETCEFVGGVFNCVAGTLTDGICSGCTTGSCQAGLGCIPGEGCGKFCCNDDACTPGTCRSLDGVSAIGICTE